MKLYLCIKLSLFLYYLLFMSLLSFIAFLPPPLLSAQEGILVHLCATMAGEVGEKGVGGIRNDLVLNFNNTFLWVLQRTSNQGLNRIYNICLVTHKLLTHQTGSLSGSKQMSICALLPLSGSDCVYYHKHNWGI